MALYATNRFAGDGATTSYEFNFVGKYIDRTHVKAYQEDDATKVRTYINLTDANFLNDTTLKSLPVTPVGSTLVIHRETPKLPLTDFVNGSRLTEYNMDLVARQGLFVAMEALDSGDSQARQALLEAITAVSDIAAEMRNVYYGPLEADPTLRPDGTTVHEGDEYQNTTTHVRRVYTGGAWVDASNAAFAGPGGAGLVGYTPYGAGAVAGTVQAKLREMVSVKDFGAVGDGVADDTAALNAFLLVAKRGHIPAGRYKITGALNFQSNQTLTGDGAATVFVFNAEPVAYQSVLYLAGKYNTRLSMFALEVPAATYPTARSICVDSCTNCHVSDVVFIGGAGGNAGFIINSFHCSIKRVWIDDYRSNGIYVNGGYGNVIEDNDIPDGARGLMGIQFVGGESNIAKNNRIAKTPDHHFGIHFYGGKFHVADKNTIKNTWREAIAVGGAASIGARVTNNTAYWDETLSVGDFGMSVAGDDASNICQDFLIEGNTIINAAQDGIGLAGWLDRGRVVNNIVRDSGQAGHPDHQSGIKIYGWIPGASSNNVEVSGNTIVKSTSSGMVKAVTEVPGLGSVTGNIVRDNHAIGFHGDPYVLTSALRSLNSEDLVTRGHSAALTAYSGVVTAGSGTLRYQQVGKFYICRLTLIITTNGTGAGALIFPLPFTASAGILTGGETAINGKSVKGVASGSNLIITNYDNTYPGANGVILVLCGILEVA